MKWGETISGAACIAGLVCSFLTLFAGRNPGVIEDAVILKYSLVGTAPPGFPEFPEFEYYWYGLHYLSVCRGYTVNLGPGDYKSVSQHVSCQPRPAGYSFRLDSGVLGNDNVSDAAVAAVRSSSSLSVSTAAPVALLLSGIVASVVCLAAIVASLVSNGQQYRMAAAIFASLASILLLSSSALITKLMNHNKTPNDIASSHGYPFPSSPFVISKAVNFEALTWAALACMLVCSGGTWWTVRGEREKTKFKAGGAIRMEKIENE